MAWLKLPKKKAVLRSKSSFDSLLILRFDLLFGDLILFKKN